MMSASCEKMRIMLSGESCAHRKKQPPARNAKISPAYTAVRTRSGRFAPQFCAVKAASAEATEVAGSMAKTSYLLATPTAEDAATPSELTTAVRYRKEMRIISSCREMGMPARSSSFMRPRSIRRLDGVNLKMNLLRLR